MRILQRFSYRDSQYARPNQKWICGRTSDGAECEIGPNPRGRCIVEAECTPRKEGSRWHCTRTSKFGGPCSDGPLPNGNCCLSVNARCTPIRSWRSKRALASQWLAAAVVGIILVSLGHNNGSFFISPGALSTTHSQLSDCGLCHTAFSGGPQDWVHTALSGERRHDDAKACLDCHDLGSMPLKQHGIEAQTSVPIKAHWPSEDDPSPGITPLLRNIVWNFETQNSESLTCATCHKEHQGAAFADTENVACLECHGNKFTGFSEGHPGYETYPYKRRTRINFDHIKHFDTHFNSPSDNQQDLSACINCHQPDPDGISMVSAPFADACGKCHTGQIEGEGRATEKGIAILRLPDIDTWTLAERNSPIGYWPEQTDGELTVFMDMLLSNDIQYQNVKLILKDLDLTDLSDASSDQIAAVQTLMWAVKNLFLQTQLYGPRYLKSQLEHTLGPLSTTDVATLTGYLSQDIIENAVQHWLPDVADEISLWNSGEEERLISGAPVEEPGGLASNTKSTDDDILLEDEITLDDDEISLTDDDILLEDEIAAEKNSIPATRQNQTPKTAEDWASAGGWYKDNNTYSLRYRPVGHADNFLMLWLNISGQLGTFPDLFTSLSKEGSPGICSKCHSVDLIMDSQIQINWAGASAETSDPALVDYPHVSHFGIMKDTTCKTCHNLAKSSNPTKNLVTYDLAVFNSNFTPLDQSICSDCHSTESAVNACTTCHNYHFVRPQPSQATTVRLDNLQ